MRGIGQWGLAALAVLVAGCGTEAHGLYGTEIDLWTSHSEQPQLDGLSGGDPGGEPGDSPAPAKPARPASSHAPRFAAVDWQATLQELVVTPLDEDVGDTLWITLDAPPVLIPAFTRCNFISRWPSPLDAARIPIAGVYPGYAVTGTVHVTIADSYGVGEERDVTVWLPGLPLEQWPGMTWQETGPASASNLAFDTLYAMPLQEFADTGDPVRVVVATGMMAHPFQYMVGVGLTVDADAEYVRLSLDAGEPDDQPDMLLYGVHPLDGIWAAVQPRQGFLLAPDSFIQSTDIGGGRERWDFNLTPLDGRNILAVEGTLFSAEFTFSQPGMKVFGFSKADAVKRSYYADDTTEYFWGDIDNRGGPGHPNAVLIQ
jgi:hypothetical protein